MLQHPRNWFLFFWLASAAALSGALVSQFVFDMRPCHLCLYQRWPYGLALVVLTPLLFYQKLPTKRMAVVLAILAVFYLAGASIAFYHAGVEQHWWAGPSDCSGNSSAQTIEELTAEIMGATIVRCDEPAFVFLGLSMAGWNVLYSLGLVAVSIWGVLKWRNKN